MKKLVYFLALGALLMPAACTTKGDDGSSGTKEFPNSSTKEYATVLIIETNENAPLAMFPGESISQPVEEIVFTEDGEALLYGKSTKALVPIVKRPFAIATYTAAPSTSSPGYNEYVVPNVGTFLISVPTSKVQFAQGSFKGRAFVDLVVKELKKILTTGVLDGNIARSWSVSNIIITVKGGSLGSAGIKKEFTGCDLYEIAGWCRGQGVKVSDSDYAALNGYKVNHVIFTGDKHFAIEFASPSAIPYFGTWTLSGTNFGYSLQNMEYDIIGSVSGTFVPDADTKTAQIKVSGKFNVAGAEYTGELDIRLRTK